MAENLFAQEYKQLLEYRETLFGGRVGRMRERCLVDKLWWKSLNASEQRAGLCAWMLRSPVVTIIRIPLPYKGVIDVIRITTKGTFSKRWKVTNRITSLLREKLFTSPLPRWRVHREDTEVVAVHCPDFRWGRGVARG